MFHWMRTAFVAAGLVLALGGAAQACDNCERHDGYRDGGWHERDGAYEHRDGYRDHDGWRDRDGGRDGWHDGRYADGCRDRCGERRYDGCHDGCGRCHDRCGHALNYSCRSGFYDCRFEGSWSDDRYRERYYDGHPQWVGGGAYGFYGH
ncbi:MAG TPA: hypothetical protein VGF56_16200 [Rhizomicrobium sp.]|jgi:hypothetical protein